MQLLPDPWTDFWLTEAIGPHRLIGLGELD